MANKRASITIAISGEYNSRALERAERDLTRMNVAAAAAQGGSAKEWADVGASLAELGGKAYSAGRKMEEAGSRLTRTLTPAVAGLGIAALKTSIDYEDAFAGVRKTVDMTEDEYDALYKATKLVAGESPVGAETLFQIEELAGQLGIGNDSLLDFSRTIAGMDIATNMDAETAASQLAKFMNITKESQEHASNLGSTVVDLGNHYATTESDIMAMSMRLAAGATTVHMSSADIMGMATALSSLGVEAEAGGSSVSTVLSKIDKAVAKGGDGLAEFAKVAGVSADDFATKWKTSPMEAFELFIQGLGGVEGAGGNLNLVLEDLGITELRQIDAMKRLSGNYELLGDAVDTANAAYDANSALQVEVDKRNETTSAKVETLMNRVQNMADTLGGPLADALTDAIEAASPVIDTAADLAQGFADMDEGQQKVIVGLGLAAVAAGPVLSLLGKGAQGVGDLTAKLGKMAQGHAVNVAGLQNTAAEADKVGSSAGKAAAKAGDIGDALEASGKKKTTAAQEQARLVGEKAEGSTGRVNAMGRAVDAANGKRTAVVQGQVAAVGTKAEGSAGKVGAMGTAVDTADGKTTGKVQTQLESVGTKADASAGQVGAMGTAVDTADGKTTGKVQTQLESVGTKADASAGQVGAMGTAVDTADGKTTGKVQDQLGSVGTKAEASAGKVGAMGTAVSTADGKTTGKVQTQLESVGTKAEGSAGKVGAMGTAVSTTDGKTTSKVQAQVEGVGSKADASAGKVGAMGTAVSTVDGKTTGKVQAQLEGVGTKAEGSAGKIGGLADAVGEVDKKKTARVKNQIDGVSRVARGAKAAVGYLGDAVASLAAAAVIGAIVAVGTAIRNNIEKNQAAIDAAHSLRDAVQSIGEYAPDVETDIENVIAAAAGLDAPAKTVGELVGDVEKAVEKHNELAEQIGTESSEMATDAAKATVYVDAIRELTDGSKLGAAEQARLQAAVAGYNAVTGESLAVIDAQNGKLSESIETIESLTAAWEREARAQLYRSEYDALVGQLVEEERVLNDAQAAYDGYAQSLADAQAQLDDAVAAAKARGVDDSDLWMDGAVSAADQAVVQYRNDMEAAQREIDTAQGMVGDTRAAMELLTGEMGATAEAATEVGEAAAEADESLDGMTEAQIAAADAGMRLTALSEDEAAAYKDLGEHVKDVTSAMESLDGSLKAAIARSGRDFEEFGLLVESTGGSVEWFGGVYEKIAGIADPFAAFSTSLAHTAENAQLAEEGLADLAATTDEIAANIAGQQETVRQFNDVVASLYEQCQTEADIAFVNSLVERGPEALGELQNIAGTYEQANVSLHDLADAQAQLDKSIADTAVNSELERMAASYRILGDAAFGTLYTVDEATGLILTVVGEGADAMVVAFDRATGECVGVIEDGAPEAQAAAELLKQSVAEGASGTAEVLGGEADSAQAAFSGGISDGAEDAGSSAALLGDEAYGALVSLPDEMEARGKVSGWSLAHGISALGPDVESAASGLASGAAVAMRDHLGKAENAGKQYARKFKEGVSDQDSADSAMLAASSVASAAASGLDTGSDAARDAGIGLGEDFSSGISSASASSAASSLAYCAATALDGYGSWANTSGWNLGINFANGMYSSGQEVANAASWLASVAAAYLHHSTPEKGALKDDDEWGGEMVGNIADGMVGGIPGVRRAADMVARAADARSSGAWGGSWSNAQVAERAAPWGGSASRDPGAAEVQALLMDIVAELRHAREQGTVVQIDGEAVARATARAMDGELYSLAEGRGL